MKSILEHEALKLRQKRRNMKNITIHRKATVKDYARAHASTINHAIGADISSGAATGAALGTVIPGIGNVVGGIVGAGGGLVKGLTSSSATRLNKKDFYSQRDQLYTIIGKVYGIGLGTGKYPDINDHPSLQRFSHKAIKDSPFKNYANEMRDLLDIVATVFPDAIPKEEGIVPTTTIAPLNKTMEKAILDSGKIPPGGVSANLETFVKEIVEPGTGQVLTQAGTTGMGAGKQAMENAAIEFIATLVEKKRNGETLPPVYDKIATGAMKVEEKVEQNVKASIAGDIGSTIMNNPLIVVGAFILIIVLMTRGR